MMPPDRSAGLFWMAVELAHGQFSQEPSQEQNKNEAQPGELPLALKEVVEEAAAGSAGGGWRFRDPETRNRNLDV